MKHIELEMALTDGHDYIRSYLKESGKEMFAVEHLKATNTCFEKADLIGYSPEKVVKAVYLRDGKGKYYGFVSPELGTRDKPLRFDDSLVKKIFSDDRVLSKKMMGLKSSISPVFMTHGTYTPFVPDYFFDGDGFTGSLEKIFIHSDLDTTDKVDISIGGIDDLAHRTSLLVEGEDIYKCLSKSFGNKIEKFIF